MTDYYNIAEFTPLNELVEQYPVAELFLENMNLGELDRRLPLADAMERADQDWLEELGTDPDDALQQLALGAVHADGQYITAALQHRCRPVSGLFRIYFETGIGNRCQYK